MSSYMTTYHLAIRSNDYFVHDRDIITDKSFKGKANHNERQQHKIAIAELTAIIINSI